MREKGEENLVFLHPLWLRPGVCAWLLCWRSWFSFLHFTQWFFLCLFVFSFVSGAVETGGDGSAGPPLSTVFINDVAFEVAAGPINVREAFGEDAVLLHSSGQPVLTNEWGVTLHALQHGAFYYLVSLNVHAISPYNSFISFSCRFCSCDSKYYYCGDCRFRRID